MQDRFKLRVYDKETKKYINSNDFKKGAIEFNFDTDTQSIWIVNPTKNQRGNKR